MSESGEATTDRRDRPRWWVWVPAAITVAVSAVTMLAWVFGIASTVARNSDRVERLEQLTSIAERVAVLEQRVSTVERDQADSVKRLIERMMDRSLLPGLKP